MKLRSSISDILRFCSFVAALCIVATHANVDRRWNFTCDVLTSWAVPFFFISSGFFFGISEYIRRGGYRQLLLKKIYSLVLPYLLWSIIALVVLTPLILANNFYTGRAWHERTVLDEASFFQVLDAMFGVWRNSPKQMGVLWFVRSLVILFPFAPLWRLFAKRSLCWIFPALFWLFRFYYPHVDFYGFQLSIGASSYFFLGIFVAILLPERWLFTDDTDDHFFLNRNLYSILTLSFWIYVTHNIFLQYITAAGHVLFNKTPSSLELLCPIAFFLASALSISSGLILKYFLPKLFCILNGGR